jgi:hypothetical protein
VFRVQWFAFLGRCDLSEPRRALDTNGLPRAVGMFQRQNLRFGRRIGRLPNDCGERARVIMSLLCIGDERTKEMFFTSSIKDYDM